MNSDDILRFLVGGAPYVFLAIFLLGAWKTNWWKNAEIEALKTARDGEVREKNALVEGQKGRIEYLESIVSLKHTEYLQTVSENLEARVAELEGREAEAEAQHLGELSDVKEELEKSREELALVKRLNTLGERSSSGLHSFHGWHPAYTMGAVETGPTWTPEDDEGHPNG